MYIVATLFLPPTWGSLDPQYKGPDYFVFIDGTGHFGGEINYLNINAKTN